MFFMLDYKDKMFIHSIIDINEVNLDIIGIFSIIANHQDLFSIFQTFKYFDILWYNNGIGKLP